MNQRVNAIDWSELESRGLSLYEGIIIASLIESEAGVEADRPPDRQRDRQSSRPPHDAGD